MGVLDWKKKKILVTGGTGAMGSVLVRRLTDAGMSVRVLTMRGDLYVSRIDGTGAEVRYGDVSSAEDIRGLCEGVTTVYHLAAIIIANDESLYETINAQGTRNMVEEARRAGVRHFIHVSSASVVYPKPTPYSLSKRKAEEYVRNGGVPWTIIRPTLVYGKNGGQEFDMFLNYLRKYPIVPFIGNGSAMKRPVYVNDINDGLVKLGKRLEGTGKVYNFSGDAAISILDFARLCLILMGQEHKQFAHVPVWLCSLAASLLKRVTKNPPLKWSVIAGITQDANLDPSEAIRDLGYAPSSVLDRLPACFPRPSLAPRSPS